MFKGCVLWLRCALCFRDVFHVSVMCSVLQQCVPCFRDALCDSGMCSVLWQCVSHLNCSRMCFMSRWQVMCCNKVFLFQWYVLWVRDIFCGVENVSYFRNGFFVLEEGGRCVFQWCSPCFSDVFLALVIWSVLLQCVPCLKVLVCVLVRCSVHQYVCVACFHEVFCFFDAYSMFQWCIQELQAGDLLQWHPDQHLSAPVWGVQGPPESSWAPCLPAACECRSWSLSSSQGYGVFPKVFAASSVWFWVNRSWTSSFQPCLPRCSWSIPF